VNFRASDHIEAIREHAGGRILDCAVVSTSRISTPLKQRYAMQNAGPVENDVDRIRDMGLRVIQADLLSRGPKVRHDPDATAEVAIRLAMDSRAGR
jgi:2-phospho-L-lactate transferase/gluconeogenesis factor (CofD/UPF0052 family)